MLFIVSRVLLIIQVSIAVNSSADCRSKETCAECSADSGCGWCDSNQSCLSGAEFGPDDGILCNLWFFRNCKTADQSTGCSNQISSLGCVEKYCSGDPQGKKLFACQKCQDFQNCFSGDSECSTWDESKCPRGIVKVNYSDPSRLEKTVLSAAVLPIEPQSTILYKCQMEGPNGAFSLIATQGVQLGYQGRVLTSSQAGGIMHRVDDVIERGDWTFAIAYPAQLPEVVSYADFQYTIQDAKEEPEFMEDEVPKADVIIRLQNLTKEAVPLDYDIHDLCAVDHLYKMVGRNILDSNGVLERRSVLVVPKTGTKSCVKIGDVLFSQRTNGYLETVQEVQPLVENEVLLKTRLIQIDDSTSFLAADLVLSEQKSFAGAGGDLMLGICVFQTNETKDWMAPGNTIVGREASSVALDVAAIYDGGEFILYEGYPVVAVGEFGEITTSFGPNDPNHQARKKRGTIELGKELSKEFSIPYEKSCVSLVTKYCSICENVQCRIKINVKPKITVAVQLNVEYGWSGIDVDAGVGVQAVVDASASYDFSVTVREEWNYERTTSLFGPKTIGRFIIPIGPVPIPGTIDIQFLHKLTVSVAGEANVASSGAAQLILVYSGQVGSVDLPIAPKDTFTAEPSGSFNPFSTSAKAMASIENRASLELSATWPSAGSLADSTKKIVDNWYLPGWIKNKIKGVLDNIKLDVYASIEGAFSQQLTAETCACCGTDPDRPHSLHVEMSPSVVVKAGANVMSYSKIFVPFDHHWKAYEQGWCLPPSLGNLCGRLNTDSTCGCVCPDGSVGTVRTSDQGCDCGCTCGDGISSIQGRDGNCMCSCICPNGIVSDQHVDGSCNCPVDCPEECPGQQEPIHLENGTCQCPAPTYECGIGPACEAGRKGANCDKAQCGDTDCNGNGVCVADSGCKAHCVCNSGWTGRECLELTPTTTQLATTTPAPICENYRVNVNEDQRLNIFESPSVKSNLVGNVGRGEKVTVCDTEGSWAKLSTGNYVAAGYLMRNV